MEKCPELREYMLYCDRLREHRRTEDLDSAVRHTVDECIKEGILKRFLMENKAEVSAMTIFEYDREEHMRMEREETRDEVLRAVRLIRQGVDTVEELVSDGISEDTARMALEDMLQPL